MADFRLPVSGTSTHKSVNPFLLTLQNTVSGAITYDGSSAVTVDLGALTVNYASSLVTSSVFTVDLAGAQGTVYDGTQSSVNVALANQLPVSYGGTGLNTITTDAIMMGNGTSNVKLLAKSTTQGQVIGIDNTGNVAYQSLTFVSSSDTTDGQSVTLKIGNTNGPIFVLDVASTINSGVLTNNTQTIGGAKTFPDGLHSQLFCVENSSNAHKVQLIYNSTSDALDFNFV